MKREKFKFNLTENFKGTILSLLLFFASAILAAQEIPVVNVTLKLKIINGDLKNSQVTITKTDAPYIVIEPNKEGDAVDLPLGFEYSITFTKMGYNTKRMLVDTHVPENREKGDFERQIADITLEKLSGKLEDNYVQMIGKIKYSMTKADFDFDKGAVPKEDKTKKNDKAIVTTNPKPISAPQKQSDPVQLPTVVDKSEPGSKTTGRNKVVKVISEDYKTITIITLTINGKDIIYKKEELGWGTFCYKDGKRITGDTFEKETQ
ncbi:MAG: hypothetical protein V4511_07295 [Bacteroidota bacterium]